MIKKCLIGLILLASILPAAAQTPVTTLQQKADFLAEVDRTLEHLRQSRQRHQQQLSAAQSQIRTLQQAFRFLESRKDSEDFPRDGNRQTVRLMKSMLCQTDISIPMGIERFGYKRGWDAYETWAKGIRDALRDDPVENPYLWYGRYDFYSGIGLYRQFDDLLYNRRAAFMQEICQLIEDNFFAPLRRMAGQLDELNGKRDEFKARHDEIMGIDDESRRNALKSQLDEEMQAVKQRGDAVEAEMTRVAGDMRQLLQRRSVNMKQEVGVAIDKLASLQVPERGRINRTSPSRIRFQNQSVFAVTFIGKGIPGRLGQGDFQLPEGLVYSLSNGGGRELYLRLRKTPALRSGRHTLKVAGEPVSFAFEDAEETDAGVTEPLVNRGGHHLPRSEGVVPQDGKGTLLTPQALMDHPQPRRGYWQVKKDRPDPDDTPYHFDRFVDERRKPWFILKGVNRRADVFDNLAAHQRMARIEVAAKGVVGQYDTFQGDCYAGLRSTIEKKTPDGRQLCPDDSWWEPSALCFDPNNLTARENVNGKQHDEETCETNDSSSQIDIEYERFVGLSFKAVQAGKYIHTLTVTAPMAFTVSVKLEWDYRLIEPERLLLSIRNKSSGRVLKDNETIALASPENGFDFSATQPGQYEFAVEALDARGDTIHRDVALAVLDR